MNTVPLLLTSTPESAVDRGDGVPRVDFLELARKLRAEYTFPAPTRGVLGLMERKTASDWRQAWQATRRKDVSVYVSLSEKVGLPLALLGTHGIPHVLLAHNLTSARKRAFQHRLRWLNRFDRIIVLCRAQERYLLEEVGLPSERVRRVYDKVDSAFWTGFGVRGSGFGGSGSGLPEPRTPNPLILSVGKERRDYETLVAAARCLPAVRFVIVASSPWSRRREGSEEAATQPTNVVFRRGLSWSELRGLYAEARLVVVPIEKGTEYAAGVNAVLEAMAMGKPLVVSGTPGIADYVEDGVNARSVAAGDADAMAAAIKNLLSAPEEAARLGRNARAVVDAGRNLDRYTEELAAIIREVAP